MATNVTGMTPSVQSTERTQEPKSDKLSVRRDGGNSSAGFSPRTNVNIKTSIDSMTEILSKISSNNADAENAIPEQLKEIINNVMRNAFSLDGTVKEGVGSSLASQRFSVEQLNTLSRMLNQLGALEDQGRLADLSEDLQLVLDNLKSIIGQNKNMEAVNLNKLAFQLVQNDDGTQLPKQVEELLTQLSALLTPQTAAGSPTSPSEGFSLLNKLVDAFFPKSLFAGGNTSQSVPNQGVFAGNGTPGAVYNNNPFGGQGAVFTNASSGQVNMAANNADANNVPGNNAAGNNVPGNNAAGNNVPANNSAPQGGQNVPLGQSVNQGAQTGGNITGNTQGTLQQAANGNIQQSAVASPQTANINQQNTTPSGNAQSQNTAMPGNVPQGNASAGNISAQQTQVQGNMPGNNQQPGVLTNPSGAQGGVPGENAVLQQGNTNANAQVNAANVNINNAPNAVPGQAQTGEIPVGNNPMGSQISGDGPSNKMQADMSNADMAKASTDNIKNNETLNVRLNNVGLAYEGTAARQEGASPEMNPLFKQIFSRFGQNPANNMPANSGQSQFQPFQMDSQQVAMALRDVGQLLLKNADLSPKDVQLLNNFVNNDQGDLSQQDAKQLNLLLRTVQRNMPASIQQAAQKMGMEELPKLWAFMQLCDLASLKKMKGYNYRVASKQINNFTASIKSSMDSEGSFKADGQKSISFMMPLYMGDGTMNYPAYIHIYDEPQHEDDFGVMRKDTWFRVCVLTESIGAVDIVCRLYEGNNLNLRVVFSDQDSVDEFSEYLPDIRKALYNTPINLTDLKIGTVNNDE
ncbi:MAG: hypothetical protein K6C05_06385 [Anaerovibrio sp.]|uniref:hypothetical protein n=1 Tax=Anaerovibrio sp. TaxID=1872532 RepID=UPI0025F66AD3|nr:hypothetical protein [Anaerovibrio sp.]MCR5176465.1 hypothetical protein [Anaerovibrio sp.]